jgi:hypothetical protein
MMSRELPHLADQLCRQIPARHKGHGAFAKDPSRAFVPHCAKRARSSKAVVNVSRKAIESNSYAQRKLQQKCSGGTKTRSEILGRMVVVDVATRRAVCHFARCLGSRRALEDTRRVRAGT